MFFDTKPQKDKFCEIRVFSDENLKFNVRVTLFGKSFVAGGFKNPDEAQRRGIAMMVAMSGLEIAA